MEVLNVNEVAKLLNTNPRRLQRMAKEGEFPEGVCGRFGRTWIFNKEELLKHIFKST